MKVVLSLNLAGLEKNNVTDLIVNFTRFMESSTVGSIQILEQLSGANMVFGQATRHGKVGTPIMRLIVAVFYIRSISIFPASHYHADKS